VNDATLLFIAATMLLLIGIYGLLFIRNLIKIVVAIQIMVKAAMLALVTAGDINGQLNLGQSMAITVLAADTVVAIVGLGLAVKIKQHFGTLDIDEIVNLEG
jgi:NADH:ubiquinone oxidoreductase subunit K